MHVASLLTAASEQPNQGFVQGGGEIWNIPPPPPPSYSPPPQELSQPRMFCACANYNYFRMAIAKYLQNASESVCANYNYFRMAISTTRMPQNQSQSIYFSNIFWGDMPPDPPSGGVLKHALHVNAKLWSSSPPPKL